MLRIIKKMIEAAVFAAVCASVLLIIATGVARLVVNTGAYTFWFEQAASDAIGLQVLIDGRPEISFFPRLSVRAYGARLRNAGEDIVVAKEAEITPQIVSLVKMTLRVRSITMKDPVFFVRRFPDGRFNFEKHSAAVSSLPVVNINRISVYGGTLNYSDVASSGGFRAEGLNIEARNLSVTAGTSDEFLKHFSFTARAASNLATLNGLVFSDVKFKCVCNNGIFTFAPATLGVFGGKCSGRAVVDLTVPVALYTTDFTLSKFRIERYLKVFYPDIAIAGTADFTARLDLRGNTWDEMMRSATGEMATTGEHFELLGGAGSGKLVDRVSGPVHRYFLTCSLSKVSIEKYLKQLVQNRVPYGPMDITVKLSLQGDTTEQLKNSAQGEVTLSGDNLTYFGGKCSGKIVARFSGGMPRYFVTCNLSQVRIEKYLNELFPNYAPEGPMNVAAKFFLNGGTADELKRSARGEVTLSGDGLTLFGGKCSGKIIADIYRPVNRYFVNCSLTDFRIEQYLTLFTSKRIAKGQMNFTASLCLQGDTADELKRSARGEVTLSGNNLELFGADLDKQFDRVESSQNFNLFDAGAYFFVGPLGLAATKGYTFANILMNPGGTTNIGRLSSSWQVDGGKALAGDVAMATKKYRLVLNGKVDFTGERFDDVTLAIVDSKGCAIVEQKLSGTFKKPVVQKPSVIRALAGPVLNLLKKGESLIPGNKCDVYYNGSVRAPK